MTEADGQPIGPVDTTKTPGFAGPAASHVCYELLALMALAGG